ncbi:MAG: hypothetical protein M3Q06_03850 [Bacteroidota bacterium]|nr:hypothetical protein [Bacteroidota bacterium]
MEQNKEQFQQSQGGSGSAEQTGRDRTEQKQPHTGLESGQRKDIADEIGERSNAISSISELGGESGRDDASGGSGDRMKNESTNESTDRP